MDIDIAFFDLDKTILSINSANLWITRELRLGHLSKRQFMEAMFWLALYHAGKSDVRHFLAKAALWMKEVPTQDIADRTREFWLEEVQQHIRPKAREMIEFHRQAGHHIALLTTSSNFLSALVAQELDIPHVLCNQLGEKGDVLTGVMEEPICFGSGKMDCARMLGEELDIDWQKSAFYTDSYSDLPMLEAVEYPKVVCPDKRLLRAARSRNWDVLCW